MKEVEIGWQEQISSHSSLLTNKRIDLILQKIDIYKEASWSNPCIPNIEKYFANLYTLFDNIFVLLNKEEIEKIKYHFNFYWFVKNSLQDRNNQNMKNVFTLLFICDTVNRIMKAALQRYEYFFRFQMKSVARIEDGLKIIEEGGGLFGGVQRISADKDKPEPEKH